MKALILALASSAALAVLAASLPASAAVNLNTASKDELVALPGIGPAKAQAIVDYRSANGPFKAVEDVRKVKGIGEKLYLQIKPELTVSGGAVRASAAPTQASRGDGKPEPRADAKAEPKAAARGDAGRIAVKDDKARK